MDKIYHKLAFLSIFCHNAMRMTILGAKIDNLSKDAVRAKISAFLDDGGSHFLATPNPEIILYASKHPEYLALLNKADLSLPDGAGLVFVSKFMREQIAERVSGADTVPEICRLAREKKMRLALIGALDEETVKKAAARLVAWGNEVVFAAHGVSKEDWKEPAVHEKMINALRATQPQIVFVAFGHPKQEEWIVKYQASLPSVRLFMGCGGALDFIAGRAKRAPRFMQKLWLEWLWRLATEPKRLKRIFNAAIVFPFTVIYASIWKK